MLERTPQEYPPILTLAQASKLLQLNPGTVRNKLSRGEFRACASRGKPLRFWRDRLVHELFKQSQKVSQQ